MSDFVLNCGHLSNQDTCPWSPSYMIIKLTSKILAYFYMYILVNICAVDLTVFILLGFELFISVLTDTIEEASGYVNP